MTPRETIPSCTLRPEQAAPQGRRWRELARAAVRMERADRGLTMTFGDDPPVDTVEQVIAVERECCPFFVMRYDAGERALHMGVDGAEHVPALDAMAEQLGVS